MNFFKSVYIDIFKDGFLGCILGLILWIFSLILLLFCVFGILQFVDKYNQPNKIGVATVINKSYNPPYVTTRYTYSGDVMIPSIQHHSDSFEVVFSINDKTSVVSVNKHFYNNVNTGDRYNVTFITGRITDGIYIKRINKKED